MGKRKRTIANKSAEQNKLAKVIADVVTSIEEITFNKTGNNSLCKKIENFTKETIDNKKRTRYRSLWNNNIPFRNEVMRLVQERKNNKYFLTDELVISKNDVHKSYDDNLTFKAPVQYDYGGIVSDTFNEDDLDDDCLIVDQVACHNSENEISISYDNTQKNITKETDRNSNSKDQKKKNMFIVDIGTVEVFSSVFKDIDGEINKDRFRITLEGILMYTFGGTCTIGFYGYRHNKTDIVIYAKCRRADHSQYYKFLASKIDTPYALILISSTDELKFKHKESVKTLFRTLKGEEREEVRKQLLHRSARDYQLDRILESNSEMIADGNCQNIRHLNVLHKIKSETRIRNRLQLVSKDLGDLTQYWLEQHKKADPYLRYVGLPLTVVMFSKKQFELIDCKTTVLHMDATGSVVRKPETLDCKKIYYYSIVNRFKESTIPLVEMITSEHHISSISTMLKRYKFFIMQQRNKWPYFTAIVVDWSWALINSVMFEWNEMSISTYLNVMFEYVVKKIKPKGITILITCCAHFIKRVSRSITEKYPRYGTIKDFLLECVCIMLLCRSILTLDEVFEHFIKVLLTPYERQAEKSLLFLAALKAERADELRKFVKEIDEEDRIENTDSMNLEYLENASDAVYRKSPFFKYFRTKLELLKIQIGENEDQDVTNKYYAPDYASFTVDSYMPFVPMWSALCLDLIDRNISRISNAYVESYIRVLKYETLDSQSRNSVADVVRKCENYISKLVVEEEMDIRTKSAVGKERSLKYPETASNPFAKEMWSKTKKSITKKKSHIRGNTLKNFAQKFYENRLNKKKVNESKPMKRNYAESFDERHNSRDIIETLQCKSLDLEFVEEEVTDDIRTMSNGLVNDYRYYMQSENFNIRIGHYKSVLNTPVMSSEFQITAKEFATLKPRVWMDGLAIDCYTITHMDQWNDDVMYFSTDDGSTVLGDFWQNKRSPDCSIYNVSKTMKGKILIPYLLSHHWLLLVVDIHEETLTLMDPRRKAKDGGRVKLAWEQLLNYCNDTSSLSLLRGIDWKEKEVDERPYQPCNDYWNCGAYISHYIECVGTGRQFDSNFNPILYRQKMAQVLLLRSENMKNSCLYCFGEINSECRETCYTCGRHVHVDCVEIGDEDSDIQILDERTTSHNRKMPSKSKEKSSSDHSSIGFTCKLCKRWHDRL